MIKLPHGWFIGADQYQYKVGNGVVKRKNKDTGETEEVCVFDKYTTTLLGAFEIIHAAECRNAIASRDMEFAEAKREIERITDEWQKVINSVKEINHEKLLSEKIEESEWN